MSEEEVLEYIEVGGKQYPVVKTGRAQARQVIQLTKWLSKHGYRAARSIKSDKSVEELDGIEFIVRFLEELDDDALIDLFTALVGCEKEDSEVYFDIAVLIEIAVQTYKSQPAVQKMLDRFFSPPNSTENPQGSSTTSELLMDGQTN